ncbi:MAG: hypothetical protein DI552_09890 [Brevundimonas sp.]|uniref:Uncharacterized protein n=1 Tax=Brevundimonas albigilva TaxID=1312364 RepID=A0ABY4SLC6_9CAUL|nr:MULTISPECIES: hypothetical protein [Brevundimonas]PZU56308.1 MAG: hypothetical protein DI552_09890 [Brevundimonas sp.]UQV17425.1 hypothetical protein MU852_10970 [Brevundimonas albigilva]URI14689.1 hypothetical protein M8231_12835 [Brevundimonas albigilva]
MGFPAEHSVLLSLLGGGFVAAFLHAALPTHWLPFVLVGRAQRWSMTRTLLAVVVAGLAHILTTAVLGGLIVAAGLALDQWIKGVLPHLSAVLLFLFGGFYLTRATLRRPVAASGPALTEAEPAVSDRAAFVGLVAMLAISPGEVLLPIYLSASSEGVAALGLLSLVFAAGTVLGMAVFTGLARAGASILRLERWARYEGAVLGLALIALGAMVALHQH